ncbi:MAG: hypothetical protein J6X94_11510 [Lachnospiraceae bacterium]|nr:hypothetical protein [Lachnospiraceae bacterium]
MPYPIDIQLEEYIPLKIIVGNDFEGYEYIKYYKKDTSVLEVAVGTHNRTINIITLLLCKEYYENEEKLSINDYTESDVIIPSNDVACNVFKAILYSNGVKISLSEKKGFHYYKIDRVYIGLSDSNEIAEICVENMSDIELAHLRYELEMQ